MNRTKIEWADYTWNPIKGICPEGCWYCYARRIYERFKLNPKLCWDSAEWWKPVLFPRTGVRVFVCSTFELFHPEADHLWRDDVFQVIEKRPDLTFIILTKRPERIDRPMPPNAWLGVSLAGDHSSEYERIGHLARAEASVKFVSFEPLLRGFDVWELFDEFIPDWMIIGRLTGHGSERNPSHRAIQDIFDYAGEEDIPVFLKNNLAGIWPGPLIQEFPR